MNRRTTQYPIRRALALAFGGLFLPAARALALARMRAGEIERVHTAKRTLESRLQPMQARVELQFLFNTLARVRKPSLGHDSSPCRTA